MVSADTAGTLYRVDEALGNLAVVNKLHGLYLRCGEIV